MRSAFGTWRWKIMSSECFCNKKWKKGASGSWEQTLSLQFSKKPTCFTPLSSVFPFAWKGSINPYESYSSFRNPEPFLSPLPCMDCSSLCLGPPQGRDRHPPRVRWCFTKVLTVNVCGRERRWIKERRKGGKTQRKEKRPNIIGKTEVEMEELFHSSRLCKHFSFQILGCKRSWLAAVWVHTLSSV